MRNEQEPHEKYDELCALALSGGLSPAERRELKTHLQLCEDCREACADYALVARDGMPMLAARFDREPEEPQGWVDSFVWAKLLGRLGVAVPGIQTATKDSARKQRAYRFESLLPLAAAACLVAVVGYGSFRLARRSAAPVLNSSATQAELALRDRYEQLAAEKKSLKDELAEESWKLAQFEAEAARGQREIAQLRSNLKATHDHSEELSEGKKKDEDELQRLSREHESLAAQLEDAKQAYEGAQAEVTNLKAEREQTMIRLASLDTEVRELSTAKHREEQYLASDRDIRELMGARQLYIADVFDVSSDSHTRRPYGRVFYTKGKSLVFYAFDLQQQPGLKNASAFQAWGNRESDRAKPSNLGILYVDSEANRRWVLRCDDANELAEINAIFVTIEPPGGSRRPTGKPFLYASLRQEVNHP